MMIETTKAKEFALQCAGVLEEDDFGDHADPKDKS